MSNITLTEPTSASPPPPPPKTGDLIQVLTGKVFLVTNVSTEYRRISNSPQHSVCVLCLTEPDNAPYSFLWEEAWVVNQNKVSVNSLLSDKELLKKYPELKTLDYEKWGHFMFFGRTNAARIAAFLRAGGSSRHHPLFRRKGK